MKATRTALGSALCKCQPLLALFLALHCACTATYLIPADARRSAGGWVVGRQRFGPAVRVEARCIDWRTRRSAPGGVHAVKVRDSSAKVISGGFLATFSLVSTAMGLAMLLREHRTDTAYALGLYDVAIGIGYSIPAFSLLYAGMSDGCWTPEPLPLPLAASATASAG